MSLNFIRSGNGCGVEDAHVVVESVLITVRLLGSACLGAECRHIAVIRQSTPQEQTALDGMIRNSRGHKMFFHEIDHQLRFLAVNLLQSAQMGFIIGFPHEGFGEHLVPHRSMDILPLFTHDHFRQQGGRRHHIPYPDAGRQHTNLVERLQIIMMQLQWKISI